MMRGDRQREQLGMALQGWQPAYLAERQNVVIERGVHQRWEFDRRALFAPLAEAIEVVRMYQEMG